MYIRQNSCTMIFIIFLKKDEAQDSDQLSIGSFVDYK